MLTVLGILLFLISTVSAVITAYFLYFHPDNIPVLSIESGIKNLDIPASLAERRRLLATETD